MIGDRYIQAVRTTGYKSAMSGKKTAKVDNSKATPSEKENKNSIKTGSSNADGLKGTLVIKKISASGTIDSIKLTVLASIVDKTNDVRGRYICWKSWLPHTIELIAIVVDCANIVQTIIPVST